MVVPQSTKHVGLQLISFTKIILFVTCARVGVIIYDFYLLVDLGGGEVSNNAVNC
jgi:hypothetical protein